MLIYIFLYTYFFYYTFYLYKKIFWGQGEIGGGRRGWDWGWSWWRKFGGQTEKKIKINIL